MPVDVLMPQLSPTMTEGRLSNWLKKEGDKVNTGDIIAEVETDKATMEVEAIEDGTLAKFFVKPGSDIPVGTPIAVITVEDEKLPADYKPTSKAAAPVTEEAKPASAAPSAAPAAAAPAPAVKAAPAPAPKAAPTASVTLPSSNDGSVKASPLARRMAEEAGIALSAIRGSGPNGRIVKEDVEHAKRYGTGGGAGGGFGLPAKASRSDSTVTHTPMRKAIARRLQESKQTVPHFYLTVDVQMDALMQARAQLNDMAPKAADGTPAYKLTVNDFIVKASAMALAKFPDANASWYDDAMYMYGSVDIAVAVAIDGGLITPILKAADQKPLPVLSNEMKELAKLARAGKLQPEQYQGGTFSVSNLGMYGIKHFDAIINPPQSAILACGAAEERAVVKGGALASATVMSLTLSVDHRVIDGALGADVLTAIKGYLEQPITMMV
ncbi:MAG: pyruvate dehydrogenase complex dihydrolipoamide acetyltransferase [Proteobacteria bacterium]|nr:pyruvate dehydrogenase complex dihydrolipoamide acetyltransferase [Pseudomonadota bacterium]